jgi:hypothetical protein
MKNMIFVAIVLMLLYAIFWLIYVIKLSSANEEWYQERYVNQEISGNIESITESSYDPNLVILVIKNSIDQNELTYGTICMDTPFRDYISIGDSVHKNRGTEQIFFCKGTDECKQFELDFCK